MHAMRRYDGGRKAWKGRTTKVEKGGKEKMNGTAKEGKEGMKERVPDVDDRLYYPFTPL
jgi:hypothetical protein